MDHLPAPVVLPEPTTPIGPFSLIVNPQAVFDAMQRSERLQGLRRRVYRPLGQAPAAGPAADATAFDASLEDEPDDFGQV